MNAIANKLLILFLASYYITELSQYFFAIKLNTVVFSITILLSWLYIIKSKYLALLIKSIPTYLMLLLIFQLPTLVLRENIIRSFLNLASFGLSICIYYFIARLIISHNKSIALFFKVYVLAYLSPLLLGMIGLFTFIDSSLTDYLASPFYSHALRLYNLDNAGHRTAGVAFAGFVVYLLLTTSIFKTHLNSKELLTNNTLLSISILIAWLTKRRLALFYIFQIFYLSFTKLLSKRILLNIFSPAILALIVFIPIILLPYQSYFEIALFQIQDLISSLVGISIRLVNERHYTLFSGREELWVIHMNILADFPFTGAGHPLPLEQYGWVPGSATDESGLTSILARYGWISGVLFFWPLLSILYSMIFKRGYERSPQVYIFIYFSILFECLYNGNLQNTYGISMFDWLFIAYLDVYYKSNKHISKN